MKLAALVTGATGFVGSRLVMRLLKLSMSWRNPDDESAVHWTHIVALKRATSVVPPDLDELVDSGRFREVFEWREADITDFEAIRRSTSYDAYDNTDGDSKVKWVVFHVAGDASQWHRKNEAQWHVNVSGTRNVVRLCEGLQEQGTLHRLVYTSTQQVFHLGNTLGTPGFVITEDSPMNKLTPNGQASACKCCWLTGYIRSKVTAEQSIRKSQEQGLIDAVYMYPSHIIGAGDTSNWATIVLKLHTGELNRVGVGGGCFANVDSVVDAHIEAASRGRSGSRWLLGGQFKTWQGFCADACEDLQRRGFRKAIPPKPVPASLLVFVGWLLSFIVFWKEPLVTHEKAILLSREIRVSSDRAAKELSYQPNSLVPALSASVSWLDKYGFLSKASRS